jgi:hypothetical protein
MFTDGSIAGQPEMIRTILELGEPVARDRADNADEAPFSYRDYILGRG